MRAYQCKVMHGLSTALKTLTNRWLVGFVSAMPFKDLLSVVPLLYQ